MGRNAKILIQNRLCKRLTFPIGEGDLLHK